MDIEIESLFTSVLGLSAQSRVKKVDFDTAQRRIDFGLTCDVKKLTCPVRGLADEGIHDRFKREWRHLGFFQFVAWFQFEMSRIFACEGKDHKTVVNLCADLPGWLTWAMRRRLEPFNKLADTLKQRLDGVLHGMLDNRSNAHVEAMNGLLQKAKHAARGFRTATNFVIVYLRMSKFKHFPSNLPVPAVWPNCGVLIHRCL